MLLHFQSLGAGQPLMLLHGLFGSADNWATVAKALATDFQVISIDLRNHGRSPHAESHSYPEMAADVLALMDHQGLQAAHVLGHSMGGKVAMQLAFQAPARVQRLVVVDMAMRAYANVHLDLIDAMLSLDLNAISTRSEAEKALAPMISDRMVRQFLLTNLVKCDGRLQWRIHLQALRQHHAQLQSAVRPRGQDDHPSLFMYGTQSDYVLASDREEIAAHFSRARFCGLPSGHWVHAEQSQRFVEGVRQFLMTHD